MLVDDSRAVVVDHRGSAKQHLLQKAIDFRDAAVHGNVDLLDHLPRYGLQTW